MYLASYLKRIICLSGLVILSLASVSASAYDKVIVFGDSLSDNGNLFNLTTDLHKVKSSFPIIPKTPPYFSGRFSNGPIWVEIVAQALNVPLIDYAYGGAWVEPYKDSGQLIPFSLASQVDYYMMASMTDMHKSDHLYVIWMGSNDYINGRKDPDAASTNTIAILQKQMEWLMYAGAKHFMILNLPNLELLPGVIELGPEVVQEVTEYARLHNEKLMTLLAAEQKTNPELTFQVADIQKKFLEVTSYPERYHVKNVTTACYNGEPFLNAQGMDANTLQVTNDAKMNLSGNLGLRTAVINSLLNSEVTVCQNPDEYLYWDRVHPTRVIHVAIAEFVLAAIQAL